MQPHKNRVERDFPTIDTKKKKRNKFLIVTVFIDFVAMIHQTIVVQLWLLTLTQPIFVFHCGQARLQKGNSGKFNLIQLERFIFNRCLLFRLSKTTSNLSLLMRSVARVKKKSAKLNINVRTPHFQRDDIIFFFRCFFVPARDGITKYEELFEVLKLNLLKSQF